MFSKRVKIQPFYIPALVVLATASVFISSFLLSSPRAYSLAGINQQLSFEGKVVNSNGTNITDGNYNVEFQIWNGASCNPTTGSGCSAIWTEDYLTSNGTYATTVPVTFTSGTYQVNLGSICAFTTSSCEGNSNTAVNWNTYPLYLSINVGTTGVCATSFSSCGGGTGVMYPLIALTSSPYSFNSNELGGLTSSQYGQIAANNTFTGSNTLQPTSNTATALQLENTDGESILQGGTSAPTNYITDADFNTASVTTCVGSSTFTDWTVVGSPTHFCYNNTPANTYEGATSLEEVLAAGSEGFETPGSSAGLTSAPTTNNSADEYYTVSFEAMQTAGTAVAANTFTITAVDATGNQTCTGQIRGSGTNTLSASGFQTVYCTLQFTSGSAGSITQLEVQDSATSGTFYFDAAQLQLATSLSTSALPTAYQEGTLDLRGVITNPIAIQNVSNSTTALQVQNAAGNNVLDVDTLDGVVALGGPGSVNGSLFFFNNSNSNNITLVSGATTGSYSLTLPTSGPTTSQCLESGASTAGLLIFNSCGGGVSLQQAYNASGAAATEPYIDVTGSGGTNYGAVTIQNDFTHAVTGNLFAVSAGASSGLGSSLFNVANTGDTGINTSDTTGTGLTVTGSSITTGNVASFTTSTANALTSGNVVDILSQSNAQSGSGALLNVSDTATLSTNTGTVTGSLVNISRGLTANITSSPTNPIFDTATDFAEPNATSSGTVSVTVGSHSNRYLFVAVSMVLCQGPPTVTYAGASLSLMETDTTDSTNQCVYLMGKGEPATGANNLVVTSLSGNPLGFAVVADSWYNVNQVIPISNYTAADGNSTTTSTVTVTSISGQTVMDFMSDDYNGTTCTTPTPGKTSAVAACASAGQFALGSSYTTAAGSSTTMTWSGIPNTIDWNDDAISINASTAETVSANVASISSSCTLTSGQCTDAANVLSLNQQFSTNQGNVLNIQNYGLGDFIDLYNGGTPTKVASINYNGATTFEDNASGGSVSAFQVQNTSGSNMLSVDTTTDGGNDLGQVIVGSGSTGESSPVLIVLSDQSSAGPPAETNGAIIYNTYYNDFYCGDSDYWIDCIGGLLVPAAVTPSSTCTTQCSYIIGASLPANYMVPGRVITISLWGIWKANSTVQGQQLGVYYGTTTRNFDTLIGTLPTALSVTNTTGLLFHLQYQVSCLTSGSGGTISGEGMVSYYTSATAVDSYSMYTGGTQAFDTTAASENIYVFPIFTTSSANNYFESTSGEINGY